MPTCENCNDRDMTVGNELHTGLFIGGDGMVHFINDSGLQEARHPTEVRVTVGENNRIEVYDVRTNEHIGMFYDS